MASRTQRRVDRRVVEVQTCRCTTASWTKLEGQFKLKVVSTELAPSELLYWSTTLKLKHFRCHLAVPAQTHFLNGNQVHREKESGR